jgi:hypothetical protein
MQSLSEDMYCHGRDLNREPLEYKFRSVACFMLVVCVRSSSVLKMGHVPSSQDVGHDVTSETESRDFTYQ